MKEKREDTKDKEKLEIGSASTEAEANEIEENKMGRDKVNALLISMSIPLMLSNLVQAMYNIVDSFFVAKINEDALAAVTVVFPINMLVISFSIGTAVGMSALLSRFLGAKLYDRVNVTAHNGIILAFVNYVLFFIIGLFAEPFVRMQTDSERIIEYATTYMRIICWFSICVMVQICFERMLQSTGRTKYVFFCQGTGAIINIIMDPILIFGLCGFPALGIKGAAYATVIGQAIGMLLGLYLNIKKNKEIQLSFKYLKPNISIIKEMYIIGIPSIIMQAIGSVMNFLINQILFKFSSTAVATFGAYFKLQSFVFMPIFGLNNGIIPIAAYNYGARKKERLQELMKVSFRYAIIIMATGTVLFWIFTNQLLGLFEPSQQMYEIGVPCLRILSLSFPLAAYCIVRAGVFQALGKSVYGMNISILRQMVVLVPCAYLLSMSGNIHLVWWAFPLAEIVGVTIALYYTKQIRTKIIDRM